MFRDAYKRVHSTGVETFFSTSYIALERAVSSFKSVTMKLNRKYTNKFVYHGH